MKGMTLIAQYQPNDLKIEIFYFEDTSIADTKMCIANQEDILHIDKLLASFPF